ncbi:hypothetical protein HZC53_06020 [Candidatus Uhrbacteria bacterium]|nr:hypothetical protein [Candidatus Uhrbacteria bacterium]
MEKRVVGAERQAIGEERNVLRLLDIPVVLFGELSDKLGAADEHTVRLSHGEFRVRQLRAVPGFSDFAGAIGLQVGDRFARFVVWHRSPKDEDRDSVFEPEPLLKITASPSDGGVWTCSQGNLMTERLRAELMSCYGLNLEHAAVVMISMVLLRAHQLVRNPECVKMDYWDGMTER